jgi:nitrite reductase (NO-forming)
MKRKTKRNSKKYVANQTEQSKHKPMPAGEMAGHEGGGMQHSMPMPTEPAGAQQSDMSEIGRRADDLPGPSVEQNTISTGQSRSLYR